MEKQTRRDFLNASKMSIGGLGLSWLLNQDKLLGNAPVKPDLIPKVHTLEAKAPHFEAKAKAMISLFMIGGPSQIDLFDPKPELVKWDGKDFPGKIKYDNPAQASPRIAAPLWKYKRYGQCGMELSELLPHLGGIADDITLIRSMHTGVNNHAQSLFALNTGSSASGRPTLGSWLSYGLGSETAELPAYVALTHKWGKPLLENVNWSNGWLPSIYQGTAARPKEPRILNLDPPAQLQGKPQEAQLALLDKLNEHHLQTHPNENDLKARIASYELAAKMQLSAKEVFDISNESKQTIEMYGIDQEATRHYGTQCLIARRLVERGVRFVQIWNNGQNWDHHQSLFTALPDRCREIDQPVAALVRDLKQRGLLDSTLVHWGGEMGRLPVIQNDAGPKKIGRDHNTYGFSMWAAGGGLKSGYVHGTTDEFSHHAVEDVVNHYDWHATLLHLFGLDHRKLTYKRGARVLNLTDGKGEVVKKLLA